MLIRSRHAFLKATFYYLTVSFQTRNRPTKMLGCLCRQPWLAPNSLFRPRLASAHGSVSPDGIKGMATTTSLSLRLLLPFLSHQGNEQVQSPSYERPLGQYSFKKSGTAASAFRTGQLCLKKNFIQGIFRLCDRSQ